MAGSGIFEGFAFLGFLGLGVVVVWLTAVVTRLRVEASVNRRVIASLQKVRPIAESKAGGEKWAMLVRQTLFGMLALALLLVLYEMLGA